MRYIKIFDTTLRDGEQSPGATLTQKEKLAIAKQLRSLGVDIIEAGFPIASQDDYKAVKQIAQEVKGVIICGLARSKKIDIERCWDAVKYSNNPRIHTFIATSPIHRDKKLNMSKDEIISTTKEMVGYAKSLCEDVEFSLEDATRTENDFIVKVINTAINAGAKTINIPDTVGYSNPKEFGGLIKYIFDNCPLILEKKVDLSVHCHDDLGLSVANSLAAIENGATQVECTINGIGERAGNASLEEIVMNLKTRQDYYDAKTGIQTKYLCDTSKMVGDLTGLIVQRNKAIVGQNAFAHEAGIHQDGVIKCNQTYEIMTPESVGWKGDKLVIGKHSGKRAVADVLNKNGFCFTEKQIIEVTKQIKNLADRKKMIVWEDIAKIANNLNKEAC